MLFRSRTLDLDIIFYDDLVYASEDLVIPHIDMENRYFVLKPLSELAPNFRHLDAAISNIEK